MVAVKSYNLIFSASLSLSLSLQFFSRESYEFEREPKLAMCEVYNYTIPRSFHENFPFVLPLSTHDSTTSLFPPSLSLSCAQSCEENDAINNITTRVFATSRQNDGQGHENIARNDVRARDDRFDGRGGETRLQSGRASLIKVFTREIGRRPIDMRTVVANRSEPRLR